MTSPEHRRFPRTPLTVEFRGRDTQGHGQLIFEGADLSKGGTFLKSQLLLEQGEVLTLEFQIEGLTRTLRAQARVVWVRRFPKGNENPGMGVAFLAMTEEDRDVLGDYLGHQVTT